MNPILIYAQDEHTREYLKSMLCNHIPLITTENAQQCLEALKQKAPVHKALIGMSGLDDDLSDIIGKMLALKSKLKIIAIGDKDSEGIAIEAVHHGASGYLLLPIKASALLATVR